MSRRTSFFGFFGFLVRRGGSGDAEVASISPGADGLAAADISGFSVGVAGGTMPGLRVGLLLAGDDAGDEAGGEGAADGRMSWVAGGTGVSRWSEARSVERGVLLTECVPAGRSAGDGGSASP
ncbi:hypothetical protein AB0B45_13570 [Nonomuraea sp. NPDC049152]|uniref:hypothetical protein n=1 Tax=Nonomuraea sp. NPDC049152 TaxID=3154350 RepID=UPI0033CB92D9